MEESRGRLAARKADLLTALRQLENDREDGTIEPAAYQRTRERCESEAAQILERLDSLEASPAVVSARRPYARYGASAAAVVAISAIVLFLGASLGPRPSSHVVTTSAAANPTVTTPLRAAERAVKAHPRSVDTLLALGNAYLNSGDATAADTMFLRAGRVAPRRPEAPTLHALVLGSQGDVSAALSVLHRVEVANPSYARAWLLDGLLASRRRLGFREAKDAWTMFLRLNPRGPVASEVRVWLSRLDRAGH